MVCPISCDSQDRRMLRMLVFYHTALRETGLITYHYCYCMKTFTLSVRHSIHLGNDKQAPLAKRRSMAKV